MCFSFPYVLTSAKFVSVFKHVLIGGLYPECQSCFLFNDLDQNLLQNKYVLINYAFLYISLTIIEINCVPMIVNLL